MSIKAKLKKSDDQTSIDKHKATAHMILENIVSKFQANMTLNRQDI